MGKVVRIKKENPSPSSDKCPRVWEKARRDRMKVLFDELSRLLPKHDPAEPPSRPQIIQKAIEHIRELQAQNEELLKGGFDETYKNKLETWKKRVKDLLARVEQLSGILRTANIHVPPLALENVPTWATHRPKHWSHKFQIPEEQIEEVIKNLSKRGKTPNATRKTKKSKENQPVDVQGTRKSPKKLLGVARLRKKKQNKINKTSSASQDLCPQKSLPLLLPQNCPTTCAEAGTCQLGAQSIPSLIQANQVAQPGTFILTKDGNLVPVITPSVLTPVIINRPPPLLVVQTPQQPRPLPAIISKPPVNKRRIDRESTVMTFANKKPIPALSKQSHGRKSGKCNAHKIFSSENSLTTIQTTLPAVSPTASFLNSFPVVTTPKVVEHAESSAVKGSSSKENEKVTEAGIQTEVMLTLTIAKTCEGNPGDSSQDQNSVTENAPMNGAVQPKEMVKEAQVESENNFLAPVLPPKTNVSGSSTSLNGPISSAKTSQGETVPLAHDSSTPEAINSVSLTFNLNEASGKTTESSVEERVSINSVQSKEVPQDVIPEKLPAVETSTGSREVVTKEVPSTLEHINEVRTSSSSDVIAKPPTEAWSSLTSTAPVYSELTPVSTHNSWMPLPGIYSTPTTTWRPSDSVWSSSSQNYAEPWGLNKQTTNVSSLPFSNAASIGLYTNTQATPFSDPWALPNTSESQPQTKGQSNPNDSASNKTLPCKSEAVKNGSSEQNPVKTGKPVESFYVPPLSEAWKVPSSLPMIHYGSSVSLLNSTNTSNSFLFSDKTNCPSLDEPWKTPSFGQSKADTWNTVVSSGSVYCSNSYFPPDTGKPEIKQNCDKVSSYYDVRPAHSASAIVSSAATEPWKKHSPYVTTANKELKNNPKDVHKGKDIPVFPPSKTGSFPAETMKATVENTSSNNSSYKNQQRKPTTVENSIPTAITSSYNGDWTSRNLEPFPSVLPPFASENARLNSTLAKTHIPYSYDTFNETPSFPAFTATTMLVGNNTNQTFSVSLGFDPGKSTTSAALKTTDLLTPSNYQSCQSKEITHKDRPPPNAEVKTYSEMYPLAVSHTPDTSYFPNSYHFVPSSISGVPTPTFPPALPNDSNSVALNKTGKVQSRDANRNQKQKPMAAVVSTIASNKQNVPESSSSWNTHYFTNIPSSDAAPWSQADYTCPIETRDVRLKPPVNWMTEVDQRTDPLFLPDDAYQPRYQNHNLLDFLNNPLDLESGKQRKKDDSGTQDYFGWMSMKMDPLVVPSTLPTLVGDLALGSEPTPSKRVKTNQEQYGKNQTSNQEPFTNLSKNIFDITQSEPPKDGNATETIVLKNIFELPTTTQIKDKPSVATNSFLSVSQLVEDHNNVQKTQYPYPRSAKTKSGEWKCPDKKCQPAKSSSNYSAEALLRNTDAPESDFGVHNFAMNYSPMIPPQANSTVTEKPVAARQRKQEFCRGSEKPNSSTKSRVPKKAQEPTFVSSNQPIQFNAPYSKNNPSFLTSSAPTETAAQIQGCSAASRRPYPVLKETQSPIYSKPPSTFVSSPATYHPQYQGTRDDNFLLGPSLTSYPSNVSFPVKPPHQNRTQNSQKMSPKYSPLALSGSYNSKSVPQQNFNPILSSSLPMASPYPPSFHPLPTQPAGPTGSSLANFNLSTIFPEMNKKGYQYT